MSKPPTISDIAQAANVSRATVSRVLTGNSPVAPEKRAAVLDAIARLNFRPNMLARNLAHGRSMAVGVLTQSMASPFFGELAQGIEQGLHGSAYHPVFASGRWRLEEELEALNLLLNRQVDALIVLGGDLPDETLRSIHGHTPLIAVGRTIAGLEGQCLRSENVAGAYRAITHLIELGHQRIAHITGFPSHIDSIDRRRGYEQALHAARLPVDERLIVEGDFTEQSGVLALEALLARGAVFTALFAGSDQQAYGVRLALHRRGLRVPDDISLIGFDDLPISAYVTPPLTTVRQHMLDMGKAAAEGMLRLLSGMSLALPTFTTELIIRESTMRLRT